jgi:hypothetical protein
MDIRFMNIKKNIYIFFYKYISLNLNEIFKIQP